MITVTIDGVPADAILTAGERQPDGAWIVTGGELDGLHLVPASDFNGDIPLSLTITTQAGDISNTQTATLNIQVVPVPNEPSIVVGTASGSAGQPITLDIHAALNQADTSGELLVAIAGLPPGATLSAGAPSPDGAWIISADQLDGLQLVLPPDAVGSFNLTVTPIAVGSDEVATSGPALPLTVAIEPAAVADAVADAAPPAEIPTAEAPPVEVPPIVMPPVEASTVMAPTLSVSAAVGVENGVIPLDIAAGLNALPASESLFVTVGGLPESATLTGDPLAGLTLTPAPDSGEDFTLSVTATVSDAVLGTTASTSATLPVTVVDAIAAPSVEEPAVVAPVETPTIAAPVPQAPLIIAPTLSVSAATGIENSIIPLDIAAGLGDLAGTQTLTVTIAGLPGAATLSAGLHNPDGTWTLAGDQLAGLTLTPAPDSGEDFTLSITATLHDALTGAEASTAVTLPVTVADVVVAPAVDIPTVLAPTLSVSAATGVENSAIPLDIATGLTGLVGTETLSVTIAGLPEGATLSAGLHNTDGSWTLTGDQLAGLTLIPAPDSGEDFTLTVTATVSDAVLGTTASTTASLPVVVADNVVAAPVEIPSVVAPTLSVSAAAGIENGVISLDIAAGLADIAGTATLSVNIAGLPEGATLSVGLHNPDGSWTLSGDQLVGLTLIPAPDSDEDFTLAVTATVSDAVLGTTAGTTASLPVMVADTVVAAPVEIPTVVAPMLSVSAAAGAENGVIPLDIAAGLGSLVGTATLSVTVAGLPEGAMLSAGSHNTDDTWTLTGDQLVGLTLTPAPDSDADFTLTVTATVSDAVLGTTASTSAALPVTVADAIGVPPVEIPIVVTPTLSVSAAAGIENGIISLNIAAGLGAVNTSTSLTVTIAGLPEGATLSAGLQNADGTWTLAGDQLTGLTLMPAADSDADFTLTITVTAHDALTGTEASASGSLPVTVADIAPPVEVPTVLAPTLSVSAAAGIENSIIPLDIAAGLSGLAGTATLSVTVTGLPEGATLSTGLYNADGSWTLTGDQLTGLTLIPAPDSGADFTLTVTATVSDAVLGTTASTTASLPVVVADNVVAAPGEIPSVVAPTLSVSAAAGVENGVIPLDIAAGLTGFVGTETLSVTIAGLPEGATLSAGLHNVDGSWTLSGDQLVGLTLMPAPDSGEDFTLTVTATASDVLTGMATSASGTLPIVVADAVVAPPVVEIPAVIAPTLSLSAAVGVENGLIPLDIAAGIADPSASASLAVTISGLPEGATLSTGLHNPDGTWTLTGDQLAGLTLTPAPDSGEDFTLTVTLTASDAILGTTASTSATLPVTVVDAIAAPVPEAPLISAPTLSVSAAVGVENGVIPIDIAAGLGDLVGTQTLTVTIAGLPEGATLSAGLHNPDGTWTLAGDQLAGLTLIPAPDSGEDFTLTITATVSDAVPGTTASTTASLPVVVADNVVAAPVEIPSVVAPTLSVSAAVGVENGVISLDIAAGLADIAGTATLSVNIAGLPEGAMLSVGLHNPDGSWTLSGDQLVGLTLIPAPDSDEDFTLTVTATVSDAVLGTTAGTTASLPVMVADTVVAAPVEIPTVVAPMLSVSAAAGAENGVIPLDIAAGLGSLVGTATLSVTVAGLPEGAMLSAGSHNTDGTWMLTGDQLVGLTLTPAPDSDADFTLTVTVTTHDALTGMEASASGSLPVTVADLAPPVEVPTVLAPTLSVSAAAGIENSIIPLDIAAGLSDLAGTATLSLTVAGLPEGATLSAGLHNADGSWTLTGDQLTGLTLIPAPDSGEDFTLTVTATVSDAVLGTTASTTASLPVMVADTVVAAPVEIPSVVAPTLSVSAAAGVENGVIPLDIAAGLTGFVGTETLSVNIAGLPEGAMLSVGLHNPDGSWTLSSDQLVGLTLIPAPDSDEDFTLTVTATASDVLTGMATSASGTLPIVVADAVVAPPVVEIPAVIAPTLSLSAAVGVENGLIPLDIAAGIADTSASASLAVTISGLPEGATLSTGLHNPDGTWTLSGDQLAGLTLTPAPDSGEDFTLTVTLAASDAVLGTTASTSATLPVTVVDAIATPVPQAPLISAPTLSVSAAVGVENGVIPIDIAAGLGDLVGTQTLTVTIAGLPEGSTLSAGLQNPDGTWTLAGDQLAGLTLTPAPDSGEDFTLTVTAMVSDTTLGTMASTSATLPVVVADTIVAPPVEVPTVLAPTLAVSAAAGVENGVIPLDIAAGLGDLAGTETLSLTITGLPDGATLSAGLHNTDGSWMLTGDQLAGLTLTPAPDSDADFTLTITATAHDTLTGAVASASGSLPVVVADTIATPVALSPSVEPVQTVVDAGATIAADLPTTTTVSVEADQTLSADLVLTQDSSLSVGTANTTTSLPESDLSVVEPVAETTASLDTSTVDTTMSDAEFLYALDQLAAPTDSSVQDTASLLDPALTVATDASAVYAETDATATTDSGQVTEQTAAPAPAPTESDIPTATFTTTAPLL